MSTSSLVGFGLWTMNGVGEGQLFLVAVLVVDVCCVAVGGCVLWQQLLMRVFLDTAILLSLSDVVVCLYCWAELTLKCKQGVFCCCWLSLSSIGSYGVDSELVRRKEWRGCGV
jgi:hypothetical protein